MLAVKELVNVKKANGSTTPGCKILGVIMLFTFAAMSVHAQDFKKALEALRDGYEHAERLHIVMKIQVFADSAATTPFYNETSDIKKEGKNYRYHFGSNEMLMNENYTVVVDHNEKEIVCSKRDVKGETKFFGKDPLKMNMDSLMNLYGKPQFIEKVNAIEHYRVFQKVGDVRQMDIKINVVENTFSSIAYHYKEGYRVKIDFEVFNKQPEFKPSTFNESVYMVFVNGKLKPGVAFQYYDIVEVKN